MNKPQKIIVITGSILMGLLLVFPPWRQAALREVDYRHNLGMALSCILRSRSRLTAILSDGGQERVFQACQGYPFTRFGWLKIPANLSL